MKHASIVPLIGGDTIASQQAFGNRPDYLLSFKAFAANDSHLVNWYDGEVPYIVLDDDGKVPHKVDVVSTVCPCAGLSLLSTTASPDNSKNDWMVNVTKFVLGEMKPEVYWGENAPALSSDMGKAVRERLYAIGRENGYTMTVYRTKSLLHGVSQIRERTFYFFWQGDKTPILNFYDREHLSIEHTILEARGNTQREVINKKKPSDDPYYKYILEEIHGGIDHRKFVNEVVPKEYKRSVSTLDYIHKYLDGRWEKLAPWMEKNGYEKDAARCHYRRSKLDDGKGFMMHSMTFPYNYIGAFVAHYPTGLTHPLEDRYINYREAMTIMGLPDNFQLLRPRSSANHICQNVPVPTARDMATEVKAVLNGKRDHVMSPYVFQNNMKQSTEVSSESTKSLVEFF